MVTHDKRNGRQPADPRSAGPTVLAACSAAACLPVTLAIIGVVALTSLFWFLSATRTDERPVAVFEELEPGMTEAAVVSMAGAPDQRLSGTLAVEDYAIPGYTQPDRPVRSKVLIYKGIPSQTPMGWHVVYVCIGPDNRVEDVFIGQD